jgi:CDP-6-deoxy-D-xylo-4-hexulose-3-dehydrase
MTIKFPLATASWGHEEQDAMQRVIASGMFTMGANVLAFEKAFAEYIGSRHCVMVNSGSSANLLMVAALFYTKNPELKLQRGDEVIVPAVSWSTTYYPLYQYGLKIKFVDIDLQTLNYDLDQLESAVTGKTRAIMAVNLLGNPHDFDRIQTLMQGRNILLMEDNCESMGATFAGKQAGTFGVMGTFSSFFSHHISTMEGGMIVTDDEELYQILLSLRAHGWTRNLPKHNLVCGEKSDDPFEESFRFVLPGYNVRPTDMQCAIGLAQLKKLPGFIAARRENASRFPFRTQKEIGTSSWYGFAVFGDDRNKFPDFESRPIVTGNFLRQPVISHYDYVSFGEMRNADWVHDNALMIGNSHEHIDWE